MKKKISVLLVLCLCMVTMFSYNVEAKTKDFVIKNNQGYREIQKCYISDSYIEIPDDVDWIGGSIYSDYWYNVINKDFEAISEPKTIIIPENVKSIGLNAFDYCIVESITFYNPNVVHSWYADWGTYEYPGRDLGEYYDWVLYDINWYKDLYRSEYNLKNYTLNIIGYKGSTAEDFYKAFKDPENGTSNHYKKVKFIPIEGFKVFKDIEISAGQKCMTVANPPVGSKVTYTIKNKSLLEVKKNGKLYSKEGKSGTTTVITNIKLKNGTIKKYKSKVKVIDWYK